MEEYDEYGNYLGEDLEEEEEELEEEHGPIVDDDEDERIEANGHVSSTAIVLHEDKALYPSASSVFGDDVEIVMDVEEPALPKSKPLLPKEEIVREKKRKPLQETEQDRFDNFLMSNPALIRTVAFVGHLHSGKSNLIRMLHRKKADNESKAAATVNVREDEKSLKISLKLRPVSSCCSSSEGKSYFIQSLDTPGHVNFSDEVECALEIADGAVLVVDVVEGVQLGTEHAVNALRRHGLLDSTVIVLNKMDRLIHELKLPPPDAFRKICNVIDTLEGLIYRNDGPEGASPVNNQILFASAEHGWCVSLESMAMMTVPKDGSNQVKRENIEKLSSMMWGDYFYHPQQRTFSATRASTEQKRSFEYFVLDPIYKIYSHTLGADAASLESTLAGLRLTKKEQHMDARSLLKRVLQKTLPSAIGCLVDSLLTFIPDPARNLKHKLKMNWKGSMIGDTVGSQQGPLLVHCVKFIYPGDDSNDILDVEEESSLSFGSEVAFRVLARVYSGTVSTGSSVLIKESVNHSEGEEEYFRTSSRQNDDEEEDDASARVQVKAIRVPSRGGGEPSRQINSAQPGMLVLLSGIDSIIAKSATLTSLQSSKLPRFLPLKLFKLQRLRPVVKLAIEPLVPAELPKMLTGLRALQRSYPSLEVQVEESGEYVLMGSGELFLDSVMRDLRERFAKGTEVKVVDPFVSLRETVQQQSATRVLGETLNGKCQFSLIMSPLEEKLLNDLESGYLLRKLDHLPLDKVLKKDYGYDILASRSVWAFEARSNALVDDTLMENKDQTLYPAKESICQGFRWACREGPLCGEQMRGVKMKLLDATLVQGMETASAGQVMKTIKQMTHQAMLKSSPALLEPVYAFDALISDNRAIGLVRRSLTQRRGSWHPHGELSVVPGTPLHRFHGLLPVLDSFGLETEIRLRSRGSVFPQLYFDRWQLCPGDPLDESITLKPLEPSPPEFLARDLVIKTRRRKGMPESIEGVNVLDQQVLKDLMGRQ